MRTCPLARVPVPCPEAAPFCSWCASSPERKAEATVQPAPENPATGASGSKPQRTCVDCNAPYSGTSNRQRRCPACRVAHDRKKNAAYQQSFRARKAVST